MTPAVKMETAKNPSLTAPQSLRAQADAVIGQVGK
jgi:hypothetical protein